LNGILAYADHGNILPGDNIDNIKENTEASIDVSREVGIEINVETLRKLTHVLNQEKQPSTNNRLAYGNDSHVSSTRDYL
jgi:hypothetical protein